MTTSGIEEEKRSGTWSFSADAALLSELGERLVGKPHIALAEMIKNSYDADALKVDIIFEPDSIEIVDNGHGMDSEEFIHFWMRIGNTHKRNAKISPGGRPLTGSKGVGRLAVQFLASQIKIVSRKSSADYQLTVDIDWEKASSAGLLTSARANWRKDDPTERFPQGIGHGTRIILLKLQHEFSQDVLQNLANEIWWLRPPFSRANSGTFEIEFTSLLAEKAAAFEERMSAPLSLWHSRILGRLERHHSVVDQRKLIVEVEFHDGEHHRQEIPIPAYPVDRLNYEIRTYYAQGRQKFKVKVDDLRDYLHRHGGVAIYDSGFRLPYYGDPRNDWLGVEIDHSHRLAKSKLLPANLAVSGGMSHLPTTSRLLGQVDIDTSNERRAAFPGHLEVQVTRDRLIDNAGHQALRDLVRYGLDWYAMLQASRTLKEKSRVAQTNPISRKIENIEALFSEIRGLVPPEASERLDSGFRAIIDASESESEFRASQIALLGPLATAGMTMLAMEHESARQLLLLKGILARLEVASIEIPRPNLILELTGHLRDWISRAEGNRSLFLHLLDESSRERDTRQRVKVVLEETVNQMSMFLRGISVDARGVDGNLLLPIGSFAEWSAIFQNVITNAINAMLDSTERRIKISTRMAGKDRSILIEDSGVGVDLAGAEALFEPFNQKLEISRFNRGLRLGGTGLGLTIVKMIAENLGCTAQFSQPEQGWSTAFHLKWREEK